jgi:hypothetical protein
MHADGMGQKTPTRKIWLTEASASDFPMPDFAETA